MNEIGHRSHARATDAARLGRTTRMAGVVVLAAVLGVTGFLAAGAFAGGAGSQSNATLSLRQTNLGRILVSSKGRTLYLFMKDANGKSACSGSCAEYWPPLIKTGRLTVGPGVKRALVGVTKRANGRLQVTYNKHPLYTFALDRSAGQTKGQGSSNFGAKWYAVSAKGRAVVKAATTTTTTDTTTTTTTDPYPPYP
jgi:predicted lipoprotein with Yx(FWY)xxD motif